MFDSFGRGAIFEMGRKARADAPPSTTCMHLHVVEQTRSPAQSTRGTQITNNTLAGVDVHRCLMSMYIAVHRYASIPQRRLAACRPSRSSTSRPPVNGVCICCATSLLANIPRAMSGLASVHTGATIFAISNGVGIFISCVLYSCVR